MTIKAKDNLLSISLCIIVLLGSIAGLSVAATGTIFILLCLLFNWQKLSINISEYKFEFFTLLYLALSSFYALNISYSLVNTVKLAAIIFSAKIIILSSSNFKMNIHKLENCLLYSLIIALLLINFEIWTEGLLNTVFRKVFQSNKNPTFYLFFLDRGAALISLLSIPAIFSLFKRKLYLFGYVFYILILCTLAQTDSLASFVAYCALAPIYASARLIKLFQKPFFVSTFFVFTIVIVLVAAFTIDPQTNILHNHYEPASAVHRLFIWDYVAAIYTENPIFGIGIGNARHVIVDDSELIEYFGHVMSPLPLHPHNSVLQILLETGAIGLFLFTSLAVKYIYMALRFAKIKNPNAKNQAALSYCLIANYYIISLISYNFWQSWWLLTAAISAILFSLFVSNQ